MGYSASNSSSASNKGELSTSIGTNFGDFNVGASAGSGLKITTGMMMIIGLVAGLFFYLKFR